ncbi:urokinase plasminogen activator surface receptor-like [Colossoma macropomum]|uniref:urokinase plasminogen activator surface receptor-like n=1 Tax=Colossoma macropomum TaxID=42526 RepID=UPI001864AC7A|nr:urokinase plasminogen activator surface receptor-like [Colossoma macropomum]
MLENMLFTFAILAVFAVDPADAKCEVCRASSWGECRGNVTDCGPELSCVSFGASLSERGGQETTKRVGRGCVHTSLCNKELSTNFKYAQWRIQTGCDGEPEPRQWNAGQPNGRKCFGCIAAPFECTKIVECSGEETMCINAGEIVAGNLMVNRGCATESMCKYGENVSEILGTRVVGSVSCCKENLCNHSVILRDPPALHFLVLLLLILMLI